LVYTYPNYTYDYSTTMPSNFAYNTSQVTNQQSYYPPNNQQQTNPNSATIRVMAPSGAELYVDGQKTQQMGSTRVFTTPALTPGKTFTYEFRLHNPNGNQEDQMRQVTVQAGGQTTVNFMTSATDSTPTGK
jgi:uncharacterized protein (TIGR03000 family)